MVTTHDTMLCQDGLNVLRSEHHMMGHIDFSFGRVIDWWCHCFCRIQISTSVQKVLPHGINIIYMMSH